MNGVSKAVGSFAAGALMTLFLVIFVPVIVDTYITPVIEDLVGDSTFLDLSSSFIVMVLVWAVMIGFMVVLGAGGIMRRFGVFGILGLVVAYYVMGDVTRAVIPIASLIVVSVVFWAIRRRKGAEDHGKEGSGRRIRDRIAVRASNQATGYITRKYWSTIAGGSTLQSCRFSSFHPALCRCQTSCSSFCSLLIASSSSNSEVMTLRSVGSKLLV